jgi:Amt family ammonium transporter
VFLFSSGNENGYFSILNANPLVGNGMMDFSGSGVIHLTGGLTALYATMILGPRRGRFYDSNGFPRETPGLRKGHSVALQLLGTMILWFGWYGFNPGSALLLGLDHSSGVASHAALTTTLAAACGAITALFTNAAIAWKLTNEFHLDLVRAMNGALSGLVANTAGCGFVDPWAASVIGIISGWIYLLSSWALIRYKIDDAVDAIPVHLWNGLWGVLAVGLFASPDAVHAALGDDSTQYHVGWFYTPSDATLLWAQIVGSFFILAWTLATMLPFFWGLHYVGWFRVNELEEIVGLDASYHGKNAALDMFRDVDSNDDIEERKEAYALRLKERTVTKSELSAAVPGSWGDPDFSLTKKGDDSQQMEQAPLPDDSRVSKTGKRFRKRGFKSSIGPKGMEIDVEKSNIAETGVGRDHDDDDDDDDEDDTTM